MQIELLKAVDLPLLRQLVQLEQAAFGQGGLNEWHLVPFIRHGRVFLAKENQEVVGMIQYMRDWEIPDKAYLIGVSIACQRRGKGLGTMLMRDSLLALRNENMATVELTVNPANRGAIKVYQEKLGFTVTELREAEYGEGEPRLVMVLSLGNL